MFLNFVSRAIGVRPPPPPTSQPRPVQQPVAATEPKETKLAAPEKTVAPAVEPAGEKVVEPPKTSPIVGQVVERSLAMPREAPVARPVEIAPAETAPTEIDTTAEGDIRTAAEAARFEIRGTLLLETLAKAPDPVRFAETDMARERAAVTYAEARPAIATNAREPVLAKVA